MDTPLPTPKTYVFRWRRADGRVSSLTCVAGSEAQAEDSARRAGWPGHDGTRLGRYRAWLKQVLLRDGPPAGPDEPGRTKA